MEKQKLPNATAVLILGILSIPACCFYGIGIVFGIVGLVLAKKDTHLYKSNPELYDGYSNVNTGRILSIIGLSLSVIYIMIMIFVLAYFGFEAMKDPALMQEKLRQMSQQ